jgi:hypothetical protein
VASTKGGGYPTTAHYSKSNGDTEEKHPLGEVQLLIAPDSEGQVQFNFDAPVDIPGKGPSAFSVLLTKGWEAGFLSKEHKCSAEATLQGAPAAGMCT